MVAISGILLLGAVEGSAARPEGVLKYAIHWGMSANDNDPSTGGWSTTTEMQMRLLHDSLVKTMPEGLYVPCLAESWTTSPDSRVYEFKLDIKPPMPRCSMTRRRRLKP
jgi:peptide/nickel transport system substrate-binding protein